MKNTHIDSLEAWETNAEFWDNFMGDESNEFHCELVRPLTEQLLNPKKGELILDIACGNGNYSEYLADKGVNVVAIDYSKKMIDLARKRRVKALDKIEFDVCDVTDISQIKVIAKQRVFDKAVANMALMDISDIKPLFNSLSDIVVEGGCFVFSMHHPCFTYPNNDYLTAQSYKGMAIEGQPVLHNYYHRPIQELFNVIFESGFMIDALYEVPFKDESKPIIIIVRVIKR